MADVQPLRALHYDLGKVGSLGAVASPPYDVIDPAAARAARRALALQRRRDRPPEPASGDPYAHAARAARAVAGRRRGRPRRRARAVGAQPGVRRARRPPRSPAAGSSAASASRSTAPAASARTSARIRAPRRTGCASRERPRPTSRPSSASTPTPTGAAWGALEPAHAGRALRRGHRRRGHDATACGASPTRTRSPTVQDALRDAELLIADGHHRYETARVYADEIGGEGEHRYVLMCLVALQDEGLAVFPTHRLVSGLAGDGARIEALTDDAARALRHRARSTRPSCARPTATAR